MRSSNIIDLKPRSAPATPAVLVAHATAGKDRAPATSDPVFERLDDVAARLLRLRWLAFTQREACRHNLESCVGATAEARGLTDEFEAVFMMASLIEDLLVEVGDSFEELHVAVAQRATGGRA